MLGQELIEDMGTTTMEQLKKHQPVIWNKGERNEGWNPQVPGLLTRWPARCVVVQSSHNGHMTEYSA